MSTYQNVQPIAIVANDLVPLYEPTPTVSYLSMLIAYGELGVIITSFPQGTPPTCTGAITGSKRKITVATYLPHNPSF